MGRTIENIKEIFEKRSNELKNKIEFYQSFKDNLNHNNSIKITEEIGFPGTLDFPSQFTAKDVIDFCFDNNIPYKLDFLTFKVPILVDKPNYDKETLMNALNNYNKSELDIFVNHSETLMGCWQIYVSNLHYTVVNDNFSEYTDNTNMLLDSILDYYKFIRSHLIQDQEQIKKRLEKCFEVDVTSEHRTNLDFDEFFKKLNDFCYENNIVFRPIKIRDLSLYLRSLLYSPDYQLNENGISLYEFQTKDDLSTIKLQFG